MRVTLGRVDRIFGPDAGVYARIGTALQSYRLSSGLIAKYYSLDAKIDQRFTLLGFGRQDALQQMLSFAQQRSRESINRSRTARLHTLWPTLDYQYAKVGQQGGAAEQLASLKSYWAASQNSDLMQFFTQRDE
jgi:hypothetical protein